MKNILITGGMGFIGSNLTNKLLEKGYHVTVLDSLYSSEEKFFPNASNENFRFLNIDLIDIKFEPYDFIYNLACPASPPRYQSNQLYTLRSSTESFSKLLDMAIKYSIPVYHSSTSEIYGDPLQHPQDESYFGNVNTWGPRACYDESKRLSETLSYIYKIDLGLDIKVGRIFNTYGPLMDINDGRVVSNFIAQALRGEDLTIYGNGNQTRSLCFIDDLVELLIIIFEKNLVFEQPFNMGNDKEITVEEIAKKVISLTNSSSKITYHDLPEDDPKVRMPNLNYVKKISNWQPSTSLSTGLKKTIAYFEKIV